MINDFNCPDNKCFLSLVHPNSDASLACDCDCYFSKNGDGDKKQLEHYIEKYPEKWEELNTN